jgi:hypothetical protein
MPLARGARLGHTLDELFSGHFLLLSYSRFSTLLLCFLSRGFALRLPSGLFGCFPPLPLPAFFRRLLLRPLPFFIVDQTLCKTTIGVFLLLPEHLRKPVLVLGFFVGDFQVAAKSFRIGFPFVILVAAKALVPFYAVAETKPEIAGDTLYNWVR